MQVQFQLPVGLEVMFYPAVHWRPPQLHRTLKTPIDGVSPSSTSSEQDSLRDSSQSNYSSIVDHNELHRKIKEDLGPTAARRTNWWAILLTFLSGVCFTLSSGLVKGIELINPMELLALRAAIQITAVAPLIAWKLINPFGPPGYRILMMVQGFIGGWLLVALFIAFRRLPLGDATSIIFSSPVFVLIMSFAFLRELCGTFRVVIAITLVTGLVLITRPPFIFNLGDPSMTYDVLGYSAAVLGAFLSAVNIVVMRKCKEVHFSVMVLYLSVGSLVISLSLSFAAEGPWAAGMGGSLWSAPLVEWAYASLVGVTGLLGQVLLVIALNLESAGKVAVTRSLDIVLAFILQICYWSDVPDIMGAVGSVLICMCVIAIGIEEQIAQLFPQQWPCCVYSW
ncbi:solute carrier family 35 member G1-like isoform X1 [Cloeon dipterum]|uniref:solute carrier family 35 member G1-like isoform X1 n=1 Tax=Cloeon dipterum TaxID=197152 RepID=UPI003220467E